jgi:signal transduction histidine kinase
LSKNFAHKNKVSQQYPVLYARISSTFYQLTEPNHQKFELSKIPHQNEFNLEKSISEDYIKLCKIYADSALMFSEQNNDNRTKLSCLNILGAYYRQQRNDNKAIDYFSKAIQLAEQFNYKIDIPNYYINIARTYIDNKQFEKAIEYGLKAYHLALDLNILAYKSTSSNVLRISYIEMKDYKNALQYQHIEASTRSEIYSQQNWNKISELDKKYKTEQKQKEIEYQKDLLDLKNAEVLRRNIIIAFLLIACLVIVVGIIYIQNQKTVLFKQKNKIQAQNKSLLTQKEELLTQYKRMEKLDQFKESLTHALVHDLKNPLSQVLMNTSNQNVRHAAGKMLRLVSNMLDIEKYETAEFDLYKEQHSLREIVEDVKNGQEINLKEKNLKVSLLFDDYLIMVDNEIIMRVFDNLLANAIRFSPLNSNIEFLANKLVDNSINISIKNQGEPVSDAALPYIFDKYRHFGKTDSSSHCSTGLGLTFCKMAIEAHGQKIRVQNVEDGVVFTFSLQGSVSVLQAPGKENENPGITLTEKEKNLLKAYFSRLEKMEVNQVSDILQVLDEISEQSTNISILKQQIRDAAFAANAGLFRQIITT